jgi:hypothetical protein
MFSRSETMTDVERDELKKEIMSATKVLPSVTKSKKAGTLSPKAEELLKAFEKLPSDWRSNSKGTALRAMFEAVLGEKLSVPSAHITDSPRLSGSDFKKFVAVVPEECSSGHDYPLGKVAVVINNGYDQLLYEGGKVLNHLPPQDCRFATEKEIDHFLDKLQRNTNVDTIVSTFKS